MSRVGRIIDPKWQTHFDATLAAYEESINTALWQLHHAKHYLQRLRRITPPDEGKARYERMLARLEKTHTLAYSLLPDIFETEDDEAEAG